jgi:hypothetical protein
MGYDRSEPAANRIQLGGYAMDSRDDLLKRIANLEHKLEVLVENRVGVLEDIEQIKRPQRAPTPPLEPLGRQFMPFHYAHPITCAPVIQVVAKYDR